MTDADSKPGPLELTHLDRRADPDAIWKALDEDGGMIVDDFISQPLLDQMQCELLPYVVDHSPGSTHPSPLWIDFHGKSTKRITGLCEKSAGWSALLCDPLYQAMGDHYLGADNYYLNTAQLICIGPDETSQLLHRDELNWPSAIKPSDEITITAIFALTDFTEENGATIVVPGSHRWTDPMREVRPEEMIRVTMKAGAALLYSGKIIHGGGPNSTADQWRIALHAGFVLGWLRAEENHQLTTPLEVARRLPERVQQLIGFRSYEQALGGRLGLVDYDDAARLLEL